MIVFTLSMIGIGSWNGKWTGEKNLYCRCIEERLVPKTLVGKSFCYAWDDGWCANVDVKKVPCREAEKMKRKSAGFCGYDWMIDSLIRHGYIISPSDEREGMAE